MSAFDKLKNFGRKKSPALNPATRAYIDFNRRKWPQQGDERNGIVLVGLFQYAPSMHCYSYVANHLAAQHGAAIRTFYFQKAELPEASAIYPSFGAEPGLSYANATAKDRKNAALLADQIVRRLKTKWDVIHIALRGIPLGDLIYDTYLRYLAKPTVILDDPDLRAMILDAFVIFLACSRYLATHHVRALIPDHTVYTQCGVLLRIAAAQGIPIYLVYYSPQFLVRKLDYQLKPGETVVQSRWPYYDYRKIFAGLPAAEQEDARRRGGEALRDRLAGKIDNAILTSISAYDTHAGTKLLADTGRKRVLVLLHDFCDAVHLYRRLLFPDFVTWIHHLLERAVQTPFDWYVKPHPNNRIASRAAMNATNERCVAELKERFPTVRFLEPSASNRQIVDEGIAAMFTVHGTAGHEFAYMGVPVVNAGENPHTAYPFNIHAQTLDEYNDLIARAGELRCDIQRADIEELFYMYYQHFYEKDGSATHPIDPSLLPSRQIDARGGAPDILEICMKSATPERDAALASYLDRVFASK